MPFHKDNRSFIVSAAEVQDKPKQESYTVDNLADCLSI